MVKNPDIHQSQRFLQSAGQGNVGLAGLGHATGVVVGENDGCGVVFQGLAHHFPRIHGCAVDGAPEQLPVLDDPVAVVQEQSGEYFVGIGAQPAGEKAPGVCR